MTRSYLSLQRITPALESGGLVLVPNNRLRNHLQKAYALTQTEAAWAKPRIYSLSEWLSILWKRLQTQGYAPACVKIVSNLERHRIWEKIIRESSAGSVLQRPQALAEQADAARQTLELWCITDSEFESYLPFDWKSSSDVSPKAVAAQNSQLFYFWLQEFRKILRHNRSVTRETSFDQIARALREKVILQSDPILSTHIYLEGFDDLAPLFTHILDCSGSTVTRLPDQARPNPQLKRTEANNSDDEVRTAALWAKSQLEEDIGKQEESAAKIIGVVVPNLGQCRHTIERIFTEVFEPQAWLPDTPRYTLPFNFSAGIPLGSTPIIHDFFAILNLRQKEIPLDDICNMLASPFWSGLKKDSDKTALAFDLNETYTRIETSSQLRKLEHLQVTLSDVIYCARKIESKDSSQTEIKISDAFEKLNNFFRETKVGSQQASDWLNYFDECVDCLNWPGNRRLDSQEFQQLNQFHQLREEFSTLTEPLSFHEAVSGLKFLVDRTPFQAQTPDSPIQILGALEAAGLQFSHLWVMGLTDNQWPAPAAPNPLLPYKLQTLHKMPHANASRELSIAQQLTQRYEKSADEIIFSSALHSVNSKSDDELTLRPSALIREIPLTPIKDLVHSLQSPLQQFMQQTLASKTFERIQDEKGPAVSPDEVIRGGARLLEDQAKCPMVAFVRWRLDAENPNSPQYGFSAIQRGNLLHDALAGVWHQLKDSNGLNSQSDADLERILFDHATAAAKKLQQKNLRQIGNKYLALEIQRLVLLMKQWLALEKERPAFSVVAIEEEREVLLESIKLKLRLDRIDQFANGEQMIVDYKTGAVNIKPVLDQRLTQPQLALYAFAQLQVNAKAANAVAFAKISRSEQKYVGVGQLNGDAASQTGIQQSSDWEQQLAQWQQSLIQLAKEFCEGHAELHFYSKDAEKNASELKPLLRYFAEVDDEL